jgi:hypothetical protein
MGKKNRTSKLPPFVPLIWGTLNSKAYKELTYSAAKLLPYFLGKVKLVYDHPERLSTEFHFSFSEAKKYGFATATFSRAYKELIEKGFIEITERGGLRGDGKSCSLFTLSNAWQGYKTREEIEAERAKLDLAWKSVKTVEGGREDK